MNTSTNDLKMIDCNAWYFRAADSLSPSLCVVASFVFGFALASLVQSF